MFDDDMFYFLLLPPIIFEAGFSLQKRAFFNNLGTIMLFAIGGTLLTVIFISLPLYTIGRTGVFRVSGADALDFRSPLDAYLFGALISATDPVATLSIMGTMGVDEQLYALVFGESVLNDAVAIVLVRILEQLGNDGFTHPSHFLVGVGQFFLVSLGSVGIAVTICATSALLLRWLKRDLAEHASFEVMLHSHHVHSAHCGCSLTASRLLQGGTYLPIWVYKLRSVGRCRMLWHPLSLHIW